MYKPFTHLSFFVGFKKNLSDDQQVRKSFSVPHATVKRKMKRSDRSWMARMFSMKEGACKTFIANLLPIGTQTVPSSTVSEFPDAVRTDLELMFL